MEKLLKRIVQSKQVLLLGIFIIFVFLLSRTFMGFLFLYAPEKLYLISMSFVFLSIFFNPSNFIQTKICQIKLDMLFYC